jgi:hypothetical protein
VQLCHWGLLDPRARHHPMISDRGATGLQQGHRASALPDCQSRPCKSMTMEDENETACGGPRPGYPRPNAVPVVRLTLHIRELRLNSTELPCQDPPHEAVDSPMGQCPRSTPPPNRSDGCTVSILIRSRDFFVGRPDVLRPCRRRRWSAGGMCCCRSREDDDMGCGMVPSRLLWVTGEMPRFGDMLSRLTHPSSRSEGCLQWTEIT